MLADPKAQALATNFAGQWLELRNLDSVSPDPQRFPECALTGTSAPPGRAHSAAACNLPTNSRRFPMARD